jgi:antitoxin VapB
MGLVITDAETIGLIRRLAQESGSTTEEVVRRAIKAEQEREERVRTLMQAAEEIQESWAAVPKSGLKADKAFFDDLGGHL